MTPDEQARVDALMACSERATAAFSVITEMPDLKAEPTEDFRVDQNGAFVWTASEKGAGRPLSDSLRCEGNLNDRTLKLVEFNGVKKQPKTPEVWKF
jgi:hypothetical protein